MSPRREGSSRRYPADSVRYCRGRRIYRTELGAKLAHKADIREHIIVYICKRCNGWHTEVPQ